MRPKAVVAFREEHISNEIIRGIGPKYRRRPLGRRRCGLLGRRRLLGRCAGLGWGRTHRRRSRAHRRARRASRGSPFDARSAGAARANRCMRCAAPMVPRRVAETAEHRPEGSRHHAQQRGRTKSQSRVRMGRNGERQGDGSKDGNCSGAHDRSPAHCRISFNRRVLEKFPAATAETGSAEKTTPGVPDAGRGLGFGSIDPEAGQAACRFPAASLPRSVITS
jgi:hypothetical protein